MDRQENDENSAKPFLSERLKQVNDQLNRPAGPPPLPEDISFGKLWQLLLAGNPFYLISAGLILYASTVVSDTSNIWMETGIPVGILAAYTVLCAATVIFIVRRGEVWSDARSLLFVILALPLALSAGLDDKLISTPQTGMVWLAGSILFTAGVFQWVTRGLGIRLSPGLRGVFAAQMAVFFLWPLLLSRLVIDWPDDRGPAMWGITLFPAALALTALPLLVSVNRGRFASAENGTPWKRLSPFLFGLLGCAGILRGYLLSISFYPAKGVGGYANLQSGFGGWMILPILLVAALLLAEWLISTRKGNAKLLALVIGAGTVFFLLVFRSYFPDAPSLSRQFYRHVFGDIPVIFTPCLAWFCLLAYLGIRRVKWAAWTAGALLFVLALALLRRHVTPPEVSPQVLIPAAGILVTLAYGGIVLWIRNRWLTLSFLWWLIAAVGIVLMRYNYLEDANPLIAAAIAAPLLVGWLRRDDQIISIGLFAAVPFFLVCLVSAADRPDLGNLLYLFGNYAAVMILLVRRYWLAQLIETGSLLFWCISLVYDGIQSLQIRGVNVIFWGLVFFLAAFLISLWKAGILQKKTLQWAGPVLRFFREKP